MTNEEKKAEANRKRSESCKKAWADGKGKLASKKRPESWCPCGCGNPSPKYGTWVKGHQQIGRKHSAQRIAKMSESLKKAHKKGAFKGGQEHRKLETISKRPLCACGCGKPVARSKAMYARGCFDATTPENQAKARQARDWDRLSPIYSKNMANRIGQWKESGRLEDIRRKGRNAKGMLNHISAKVWIIRDPYGNVFRFSNLREWARNNQHRFHDDNPDSKNSFAHRIADGITALLAKRGISCSYHGWTAVSKSELESGGADLLGRNL